MNEQNVIVWRMIYIALLHWESVGEMCWIDAEMKNIMKKQQKP